MVGFYRYASKNLDQPHSTNYKKSNSSTIQSLAAMGSIGDLVPVRREKAPVNMVAADKVASPRSRDGFVGNLVGRVGKGAVINTKVWSRRTTGTMQSNPSWGKPERVPARTTQLTPENSHAQ